MPFKSIEKRKAYQKAYHKKHYKDNKEYYAKKAKIRNKSQRTKNKEFVNRYKSFACCVDCGESNPLVLEFDHGQEDMITKYAAKNNWLCNVHQDLFGKNRTAYCKTN